MSKTSQRPKPVTEEQLIDDLMSANSILLFNIFVAKHAEKLKVVGAKLTEAVQKHNKQVEEGLLTELVIKKEQRTFDRARERIERMRTDQAKYANALNSINNRNAEVSSMHFIQFTVDGERFIFVDDLDESEKPKG